MKSEIKYHEVAYGSPAYQAALRLRDEVLRRPLGLSLFDEDLGAESKYKHLVGSDEDGVVAAYLTLRPYGEGTVKMQQVAVAAHRQGEGIGRELVAFAEGFAADRGASLIVLHAREVVIGFYEKLGYHRVGGRFSEIGIPHFKAEKRLR